MKTISHEEMLDLALGQKGSEVRDQFEKNVDSFLIGEAIRQTRQKRKLTQKQLGELIGVQEAQICKIESGKSITYNTIVRVFKALGAKTATLDLGALGRVALW